MPEVGPRSSHKRITTFTKQKQMFQAGPARQVIKVRLLTARKDMIVPHDQLRPETLLALIEEFVTRDGAVHGHVDTPLDQRLQAVRQQLEAGTVQITFDEESETFMILASDSAESLFGTGSKTVRRRNDES